VINSAVTGKELPTGNPTIMTEMKSEKMEKPYLETNMKEWIFGMTEEW
jgi:hypothetical protein